MVVYFSIEYLITIDMFLLNFGKQGGRARREHRPPTRKLITPFISEAIQVISMILDYSLTNIIL